jgi:gamma-glutamyltranspeptidase/glutathione hydrolase
VCLQLRKVISISAVLHLLSALNGWSQVTETPVAPRAPIVAASRQGVVVSGKPAATEAGVRILKHGGNAADAGAATLLALSVTYVGASCLGGEIPILVYSADQKNVKPLAQPLCSVPSMRSIQGGRPTIVSPWRNI